MADKHKGKELKGRTKEAAGSMADREDLRQEGEAEQTEAKVKRGVNKVKDKLKGDR
jgi:uncharacterized protein YjbJ (UPF0337 family)